MSNPVMRKLRIALLVVLVVGLSGAGFLFYRIQRYGVPDELQLHVMGSDGSNQQIVSQSLSTIVGPPSWSPDGRVLAFEKEGDICLVGADGKNERCLTSGEARDELPQFSPDGSKIAFSSESGDQIAVWTMDADGSRKKMLTNKTDWAPLWSPDGSKIAFTSGRKGSPGIYVMDPDGSNQIRLTKSRHESAGQFSEDQAASWSPDGKQIVFTSTRSGGPVIYIMDADGKNQRRLVGGREGIDEETNFAAWSPAGDLIAFERGLGATFEIWVIRPDGSGLKQLTRNKDADRAPAWSPDGSQIAFMSTRSL